MTGKEAATQVLAKQIKLTVPTDTTPPIVVSMLDACLQYNAVDRPDFAEIAQRFQELE